MGRHHLVLIPGFAGFDLLEPVSYFDGVQEPLQSLSSDSSRPVLHFYENLATAGLETRSKALGLFLARLVSSGCALRARSGGLARA